MREKTMLFRMTKDTTVFLKGQKVFTIISTGALAALVRGRYKKKGRWVNAWVHWDDPENPGHSLRGNPNCKFIGYATLDESFKEYVGVL